MGFFSWNCLLKSQQHNFRRKIWLHQLLIKAIPFASILWNKHLKIRPKVWIWYVQAISNRYHIKSLVFFVTIVVRRKLLFYHFQNIVYHFRIQTLGSLRNFLTQWSDDGAAVCGYVSKPYMVTRGQTKLGLARALHVTKFTHLHMPNSL